MLLMIIIIFHDKKGLAVLVIILFSKSHYSVSQLTTHAHVYEIHSTTRIYILPFYWCWSASLEENARLYGRCSSGEIQTRAVLLSVLAATP